MADLDAQREGAVPPPPRPIESRDVDAEGWWISTLTGIVLVLVGLWLLSNLFESVVILAWIVGVSFVVAGVAEVLAHRGERGQVLAWVAGALLVVGGITALVWPAITLWALAVVAGLSLILAGLAEVAAALIDRDRSGPEHIGLGAVAMALGAVVLAWPEATVVVLALSLGIHAVVAGLIGIVTGWQARRFST